MASGPITSQQVDGETTETVTDFIFLGSKITADGDCSLEIKRHLLLGRKAMTNLDKVLNSKDITLPTKVCLVKAVVFPVVMYGYESWTVKKAELKNWCLWIVALEEDSWESLGLQGDQTNQSWRKSTLNIYWKDWYWSSNSLAIWCEEPTHWKRPWCWERVKAGGEEGDKIWDDWMVALTQWTWVWASSGKWCRTGKSGMLQSMGSQRVEHDWATEQQLMCWALCSGQLTQGNITTLGSELLLSY